MVTRVSDRRGNWLRQSFMVPRQALSVLDERQKLFSDVSLKFTDTTLGGNFAINPPPQFTRFADLKVKGRFNPSRGMGRYYSEAMDDNGQLVNMRFGVPEFNSLTTFFTGFFNSEASLLARTGRQSGLFYKIGKAAGFVVSLPLAPIIAAGSMYRFLAMEPASKYYYLKPTMPLYWNAVNTIANAIAVNMGIVPPVYGEEQEEFLGGGDGFTPSELKALSGNMNIYREGGGIDIYAVATRAARLSHKYNEKLREHLETASSREDLKRRMQEFAGESIQDPGSRGIDRYLDSYIASAAGRLDESALTEKDGEATGRATLNENQESEPGWYDKLVEFSKAELADGAQFVTFRVDHVDSVSESFSNSAGEPEIANKINSASSSARQTRFSFAEGNLGSGGIAGVVEGALGGVKDVVSGFVNGIGMSGIAAAAGSAFIDIPQIWESASADLPTADYTIQLRSPYGNKLSRFQNLYVPLAMLLAGALPLSTGKRSYTSPFLVEIYSKGKNQTRLGIIDSMSVTRGVGNLGWTREGEPLGIDVSFSVLDLSSVMHMPISANFSLNPTQGIFDEDSVFNDYMAVLGGLGLTDQTYIGKKLRLNITRMMTNFDSWTSVSHFSNWAVGTLPGRLVNALAREVDRPS